MAQIEVFWLRIGVGKWKLFIGDKMKPCHTKIANYEHVVTFFGRWPSFHDYEVVSMYLERSWDGEAWPTLTIEFFCFNFAVGTEDPNRQDCLVTIRFGGLLNVKFDGFNHQNAINGLIMTDTWSENLNRQMFDIQIVQGFGLGAHFECEEIEVLSVVPCDPEK